MNTLNKLTIKNLKLNKKRTIVTIIGIILSTALICAVAGMYTSFIQTLVNDAINSSGNKHILIKDVNNKDITYFINNPHVKNYYLTQSLGYALINENSNYKPYLYIEKYTKKALEEDHIKIVKGRMPQNEEEIVINNSINNEQLNLSIGDKITLNVGDRVLLNDHNVILNQNDSYDKDNLEEIINTKEETYTITGFIEKTNNIKESVYSPGFMAITYTEQYPVGASLDVSLLFKNPKYYKEFTSLLDQEFSYDYGLNNELLRWQMAKISDNALKTIFTIIMVVIGIIIFTSVFVIRNSFNISITEKKKQYGMLASIGATKKQIKKNVLYEGFILGLIGIPIGILSGLFADFILVKVINILLLDSLNGLVFAFKVPYLAILASIILASITIYFSVIRAAQKSAKIAPIEAIRSNDEIKIKAKKLKTPRIITKLFGVGGVIAYKNLKRSKSKYRTTVISLVVSISIFIALSTLITYGFKMSNIYYKDLKYNIQVYKRVTTLTDYTKVYDELLSLTNLGEVNAYTIPKYINYYVPANYLSTYDGENIDDLDYSSLIKIVSLGDKQYQEFLKEINGNYEDISKGGILIDDYSFYDGEKYVLGNTFNIKEHDILKGKLSTRDNQNELNIEIVKRTNKRPMGLNDNMDYLVVSDTYFNNLNASYTLSNLYLDVKNPDEYSKSLDTYLENKNDILYTNVDAMVKQEKSMIILIAIFLYGFIIVISLIGITNIFNTITTNMNLRQKEFAMLKSIGMTKKEFNRMIRLESLFMGLKSLTFGIPLGVCLSYLIYLALVGEEDIYHLPINSIIIAIASVFLLIACIMKYSINKINKQNIIETIRNENI